MQIKAKNAKKNLCIILRSLHMLNPKTCTYFATALQYANICPPLSPGLLSIRKHIFSCAHCLPALKSQFVAYLTAINQLLTVAFHQFKHSQQP